MPFCRNCEMDYKGNVSVCPECGDHLIEIAEDEEREEELAAEEVEQLLLYRSPSPEITEEMSDALRDAGIAFEFRKLEVSSRTVKSLYRGQNVDGEFYVSEDDFETAKEIAEGIIGDLDEDIV